MNKHNKEQMIKNLQHLLLLNQENTPNNKDDEDEYFIVLHENGWDVYVDEINIISFNIKAPCIIHHFNTKNQYNILSGAMFNFYKDELKIVLSLSNQDWKELGEITERFIRKKQ